MIITDMETEVTARVLRLKRLRVGHSRAWLGRQLELAASTIGAWECGYRPIPKDYQRRLVAIFYGVAKRNARIERQYADIDGGGDGQVG